MQTVGDCAASIDPPDNLEDLSPNLFYSLFSISTSCKQFISARPRASVPNTVHDPRPPLQRYVLFLLHSSLWTLGILFSCIVCARLPPHQPGSTLQTILGFRRAASMWKIATSWCYNNHETHHLHLRSIKNIKLIKALALGSLMTWRILL